MLMRPSGPCSLNRITQSRSVWRSIPPILAASSREAPSSTAAIARSRRACAASFARFAIRRTWPAVTQIGNPGASMFRTDQRLQRHDVRFAVRHLQSQGDMDNVWISGPMPFLRPAPEQSAWPERACVSVVCDSSWPFWGDHGATRC